MRRTTTLLAIGLVAILSSAPVALAHPTAMPAPAPAAETKATHHTGPHAAKRAMSVTPKLTLDAMAGWNLHVATTGFTWTPRQASGAARQGGGHAHVYVDGKKLGRMYSPWLHLTGLKPGKHRIKVELNANDHAPWTWRGKRVSRTVTITEPKRMAMAGHMHEPVASPTAMRVRAHVSRDAMAGHNLRVTTTGFRFTPGSVNAAPVAGTGHAHVYVDGVKLGRLYGRSMHLAGLKPGKHRIKVELNTNTHAPWTWQGEPVAHTTTVTVR